MSPQPEFGADDFSNPDAPEDERLLRPDHPAVRDLSYERSRDRQLGDLMKGSLFDPGWERQEPGADGEPVPQVERLELYLKERPRGREYVSDFVFRSKDLPVIIYGILINRGRGLEIAELELFRTSWGYFDPWGDFVDVEEGAGEPADGDEPPALITSDLLRRLPLGRIVALAQQRLAQEEWRTEGVVVLMGRDRSPDELSAAETLVLESAVTAARQTTRGRPSLPDELLESVACAYLEEAVAGAGLLRRMSARFDRPQATVRDWIAAARHAGFLTPAQPGRRGAAAGPKLSPESTTAS
ncbi:hypothetical protein [Microbacterium terrisoli]|uniref:hypothetical protein n=1 Tax=Microbacterium terrisoli TaxID=3242192 RepID=UPI002803C928|nr:hypothetical protein [Microbacterium protaetiae]